MKTHILTALMALVLTACASHHRDVASVQDEQQPAETISGRADYPVMDGAGDRGGRF